MIGLLIADPWTRTKCLSSRIRAASNDLHQINVLFPFIIVQEKPPWGVDNKICICICNVETTFYFASDVRKKMAICAWKTFILLWCITRHLQLYMYLYLFDGGSWHIGPFLVSLIISNSQQKINKGIRLFSTHTLVLIMSLASAASSKLLIVIPFFVISSSSSSSQHGVKTPIVRDFL